MSNEFIVDQILPSREIHLLGGPSGAGKSRWLFQTLLDWEQGIPILGHKSYPVPWVYVASDRSKASVDRTLHQLDIDPKRINTIPAWDKQMSLNEILDELDQSRAKLAVIESFGSFVDPPANSNCVKKFLSRMAKGCRTSDATMLGVMESPKLKPFEKYESTRQRISGAAAWGHFSETIFMMEAANPKIPDDPYRTLTVCPRNGPGSVVDLCFNHQGRLLLSKLAQSIK